MEEKAFTFNFEVNVILTMSNQDDLTLLFSFVSFERQEDSSLKQGALGSSE